MNDLIALKNIKKNELDRIRLKIAEGEKTISAIKESIKILQKIASETQSQISFQIESIVQRAIDVCWQGRYQFSLTFDTKRGATEANICLLDSQGNQIDPMTDCGGGVVDVVSFALRLSAWSISKSAPIIILDEPFKYLSQNLQCRIAEVIRELSKKLNIQFIITTHNDNLSAVGDRIFETEKKGNKSEIKVRRE